MRRSGLLRGWSCWLRPTRSHHRDHGDYRYQYQRLQEDWNLIENRKKPGQEEGMASLDFLPGGKVKVGSWQ